MSKLRELVDRVNTQWAVKERPFDSSAPVVGPVIVAMRRAWNWMSTKWYVKPILEQQVAFNSTIVQIINEICVVLDHLEKEQARVPGIESSLNHQIREAEDMSIENDRTSALVIRDLARLRHQLSRMSGTSPGDVSALKESVSKLEESLRARGKERDRCG